MVGRVLAVVICAIVILVVFAGVRVWQAQTTGTAPGPASQPLGGLER
jgi:hypothetical protein